MRKDFSTNVAISSKEVADSLFSGTKPANLVDNKDKKKVLLRMDHDLYNELWAEAKADHRSLNAYILTILDNRDRK